MLKRFLGLLVVASVSLPANSAFLKEADSFEADATTNPASVPPLFTHSAKGWAYDANANCWAMDSLGRIDAHFSWTGGCSGNRISGNGTITWSYFDQSSPAQTITGNFAFGVLDGSGKATWPDGRSYEGAFKNSSFDGNGKLRYKNGDIYEGEFRSGEFDGHGVFVVGRRVMEGEFRQGVLSKGHSQGVGPDGSRYDGEIKDGKKEGQGTLVFMSGTYEGQFHLDEMSGPGVLHKLDGTTLKGIAEAPREDSNPLVQTIYPPLSRRLSEEGRVIVAYVVQPDGRVTNIKVAASSSFERLDKAATEAVAAMHYIPAQMAGVPIAITKSKTFRFVLD